LYRTELIHRRAPWETTGPGTGYPAVGALVQPYPTADADRGYPFGRSWGKLLAATRHLPHFCGGNNL